VPTPITIPSATAVRTRPANGGNLFRLALDNLGDALQWTRLASSNGLIDPFLPPNTNFTLTIPPINRAFSDSGVLRPNVHPVFSVGGVDVLNYLPINTGIPGISGTLQVGQTLIATPGTWKNTHLSFAYQWLRAGLPIAGAQSATYIIVSGDVGNSLSVSVTAAAQNGASNIATSASTNSIVDLVPTINIAASIPGTPIVGSPITAVDALWNNSVIRRLYQWKSAGVNASGAGANTLTYTPAGADLGNTLTLTVTAINSGGTSAPSISASSAAVIASTGGILDFSQSIDSSLIVVISV
jgi:hypothetical protein